MQAQRAGTIQDARTACRADKSCGMNGACWECDKKGEIHNHHVVPRSKGGTRTVPLCLECHGKVHGRKMNSSELVKASYARRRAQNPNIKFGMDDKHMKKMGKKSGEATTAKAIAFEQKVLFWNTTLDGLGYKTLKSKVQRLNELGFKTRRGCEWSVAGYNRTLKRALSRVPQIENKVFTEDLNILYNK